KTRRIARSRPHARARPGEEGDLRLGGQLALGAAGSRARPAARGRQGQGLSRGRRGVQGKAQTQLHRKMKKFPLEPIEKASRRKLRELQLTRLKATLKRAYERVPHYRKKFDAAGVKPRDLKTLEDLAKFPFTAKADLRDTYPFGM